jgi:alpha-D-xyloside xylohydrolase
MRLLAFDFPKDKNVWDCKDQFMYGPALLVCPVITAGSTQRNVYLPEGTDWIDFWTGEKHTGGQTIIAGAPKEKIPLYIKTGAIVPTYLDGKKTNTLENSIKIVIYKGNDGYFELYKDDGKSVEYTKNAYAYIPFRWNDKAGELIIDTQKGGYNNGKSQEFHLVVVDGKYENRHAVPVRKIITYSGVRQTVKL